MTEQSFLSFINKGTSFFFIEEDFDVELWLNFIGKEKIYVKGQLICEQINFSFNSKNEFEFKDNKYSISLKNLFFKFQIICMLSKNGKEIKRTKMVLPALKFLWNYLLIFIISLPIFISLKIFVFSGTNTWLIGTIFTALSLYISHINLKIKFVEENI